MIAFLEMILFLSISRKRCMKYKKGNSNTVRNVYARPVAGSENVKSGQSQTVHKCYFHFWSSSIWEKPVENIWK